MAKASKSVSKFASSENARVQVGDGINISKKQHTKLLDHLMARADAANSVRCVLTEHFERIDKEIAGYLMLEQDDKKRVKDNQKGKGPKVHDTILPLTIVQLDEALTFLLMVMAPDSGIYSAIGPRQKQLQAKAFAALMNRHAEHFQHYANMARMFFDMLKYNLGGCTTEWCRQYGNKVTTDQTGMKPKIENDIVYEGNRLEALDMYNFLFDTSIPITELAQKGEFFATIELISPFRLQKAVEDGELFNVDLESVDAKNTAQCKYFKKRPVIRGNDGGAASATDWVSVLTVNQRGELTVGLELMHFAIWLRPADFGLSNSKKYEIWRITTLGDSNIVNCTQLDNAHAMLPIACARPWDDGFEHQTKSYGEHLLPYQRFASFQMNVHQRSARKKLYGITVYNKNVIPLMEHSDIEGGLVAANPSSHDFDIRRAIHQFNDGPDTTNTINDIQAMDGLMQKVLPTDILKQVTDLERATKYQAAAAVQGANRRNLKIAKMIDSHAMTLIRLQQMYNIFQYQEVMEILTEEGDLTQIDPKQLRDAGIEFAVSDGLKGIDKLLIIENIKEALTIVVQNQAAIAQIDVVALLNYWTSMAGDHTDFQQFRIKSPLDALPPEQKQAAFELLQQAMAQQEEGGQ